MAPLYLVLALIIQCNFIYADTEVPDDKEELRKTLQKPVADDEVVTDLPSTPLDSKWFDTFILPNNNVFPSSSASMMAQVTNSNKTMEEQVIDIQEMAEQMSNALKHDVINLLSSAIISKEKEVDENGLRKRRSIETPMDSTKMVMRLLKHIKSNNEYQNIAIDKMMSAQEIAEKFGIEFNPDPEILSDLAIAANDHAQEMTHMLNDALKNITTDKVEFVPVTDEPKKENETYYVYGLHNEESVNQENNGPAFEYIPDLVSKPQPPINHVHYTESFPFYNYPYESQINSPPMHIHNSAPVTPKPSLYDPFMYPFTPASDYYSPYCSVEPIMPGILVPVEDLEPEPELVGEEVVESITSKMIVEKGEEPGSTTVNHVTSYTISEKSHFKPPQIEKLPQHFQYCFFLI